MQDVQLVYHPSIYEQDNVKTLAAADFLKTCAKKRRNLLLPLTPHSLNKFQMWSSSSEIARDIYPTPTSKTPQPSRTSNYQQDATRPCNSAPHKRRSPKIERHSNESTKAPMHRPSARSPDLLYISHLHLAEEIPSPPSKQEIPRSPQTAPTRPHSRPRRACTETPTRPNSATCAIFPMHLHVFMR